MTNKTINKVEKLSDNFRIIKLIGQGSFGSVYLTHDKNNNKYASKVEARENNTRLIEEYYIYKSLFNKGVNKGIPQIYNFIKTPKYYILVMDLLGKSLDSIFDKLNNKFSVKTCLLLAIDIINILENIHNAGYIHRDIKPNNFLLGKNKNILYITDFGLSKKYIHDGKHIKYNSNKKLVGTLRYASINMHMGIEPSRRDDLESVGYMLIYFLKGKLPWQGLKKRSNISSIEMIGNVKLCTNLNKLCYGFPDCFKKYIEYCRDLKFEEKPDYNYLKNLFIETANKHNMNLIYEWCD
jgi:serine/threonine protein kinase